MQIQMKIGLLSATKCSSVILVVVIINFVRIFAVVLWSLASNDSGLVKNGNFHFSVLSVAISLKPLEIRLKLFYC